jgi:hypothetical protein
MLRRCLPLVQFRFDLQHELLEFSPTQRPEYLIDSLWRLEIDFIVLLNPVVIYKHRTNLLRVTD